MTTPSPPWAAAAAAQPNTQPDTHPNTQPGTQPRTQPGTQPSTRPTPAVPSAAADGVLTVAVHGIGLLGPGLAGWAAGQAALRDPSTWQRVPTVVPAPERLPATERRRAGTVVKASTVVADEAVAAADSDPAALPTVFTSSTGEPANCHLLCEALAAPGRMVSPTRFTNSVHNAAAGYWHIATRARQPSTSLSGYDASFAAGLLEAAVQCVAGGHPVLLVACDVPYPEPLHSLRPVADVFGVAFVLAPPGTQGRAAAVLTIGCGADAAPAPSTQCNGAGLETLRQSVPAARALPLLQALATRHGGTLVLEGWPGLALQVGIGWP